MTEACTALAVADYDECCKAEALAALDRLRDAVDVHQLLDQLFAAIVRTRTTATIVTTATTAIATTTVATGAAATVAAGATTTATAAATRTTTATAAVALVSGALGHVLSRDVLCGRLGCDYRWRVVFVSHVLELQSGFARGIGKSLHATVVEEAAAIEHDLGHARCLAASATRLPTEVAASMLAPDVPRTSFSSVEAEATVVPAASSITWA